MERKIDNPLLSKSLMFTHFYFQLFSRNYLRRTKHVVVLLLLIIICWFSSVPTNPSSAQNYALRTSIGYPSVGADIHSSPTRQPALPGIWLSLDEIHSLPTSGPAWEDVLSTAGGDFGDADVSDQNSNHDVYTLAGALVCVRTGQYCNKTVQALRSAIGTEEGARWLAIGRNLTAYTIAADLLRADGALADQDLKEVSEWLAAFLTRTLSDNNSSNQVQLSPFESGSNASAQEGAVYAAVAAYLGEDAPHIIHPNTGAEIMGEQHLDRVWDAFRRYACDPTAPDYEDIDMHEDSGWAFNDPTGSSKCGINPKGATKAISGYPGFPDYPTEMRIDGAIVNDMGRGCDLKWKPCATAYPWVGLEGFVPAAWILHRAGYPAFEVADQAVFRTLDFLWWLDERSDTDSWFLEDGKRADEIVYLVKSVYGKACNPIDGKDCLSEWTSSTTGRGRTIGFTDWTHAPNYTNRSYLPIVGK